HPTFRRDCWFIQWPVLETGLDGLIACKRLRLQALNGLAHTGSCSCGTVPAGAAGRKRLLTGTPRDESGRADRNGGILGARRDRTKTGKQAGEAAFIPAVHQMPSLQSGHCGSTKTRWDVTSSDAISKT